MLIRSMRALHNTAARRHTSPCKASPSHSLWQLLGELLGLGLPLVLADKAYHCLKAEVAQPHAPRAWTIYLVRLRVEPTLLQLEAAFQLLREAPGGG